MEAVVDTRRVAAVAGDVTLCAKRMVTLVIDYALVCRLLGGRAPSAVPNKSAHAAGDFGVWESGGADGSRWKWCVMLAMGHTGRVLKRIFGDGMGWPVGTTADVGLSSLAERAVESGLSAQHTKELFEDVFRRWAWAAQSLRTGRAEDIPNLPALLEEAEACKLAPVVEMQDAAAAAAAAAATLVDARLAEAGIKRKDAGSSAPATTAAATAAVAAAAAAAGGGVAKTPRGAKKGGKTTTAAAAAAQAQTAAATTYASATAGATALAPAKAAAAAAAARATAAATTGAWTPTYLPGSILKFADRSSKDPNRKKDAIEHFDYECRLLHLDAHMPCGFVAMRVGGCRGATGTPPCQRCVAQAARTPPTAVPAGLVAKIKAACDAPTAGMIV